MTYIQLLDFMAFFFFFLYVCIYLLKDRLDVCCGLVGFLIQSLLVH